MKFFRRIIIVFLLLLNLNSFAGIEKQKEELLEIINNNRYSEIFKYYDKETQEFSLEILQNLFNEAKDPSYLLFKDIEFLFHDFSSNENELILHISAENQQALDNALSDIEREYPESIANKLEEKMYANNWSYLGVSGSAKLLMNSALTGPKIYIDIVSGGASKISKIFTSKNKIKKLVKFFNLPKLKKSNILIKIEKSVAKKFKKVFKGIEKFLSKRPKYFKNLREKISDAALKTISFIDTDAFKVYLYIVETTLNTTGVVGDLTDEDKKIIKQYSSENKNDANNILAQYFAELVTSKYQLSADLLGKISLAMYIKLFETGVINVMQGEFEDGIDIESLAHTSWDLAKTVAEFIPVAGPLVELTTSNIEAVADADASREQVILAHNTFKKAKNREFYIALSLYRLQAILDSIKQIQNNNNYAINTDFYFDNKTQSNSYAYDFLKKAFDYGFKDGDFTNKLDFSANSYISSAKAEMLIARTRKILSKCNNTFKTKYFNSYKNITRGEFVGLVSHYIGIYNKNSNICISLKNSFDFKQYGISNADNFRGGDYLTNYEILVMLVRMINYGETGSANSY